MEPLSISEADLKKAERILRKVMDNAHTLVAHKQKELEELLNGKRPCGTDLDRMWADAELQAARMGPAVFEPQLIPPQPCNSTF